MKTSIPVILLSTIALSLSVSSQAEIYKWTDAKGVTHYSATPPVKAQIKSKTEVKHIGNEIRSAAGRYRPTTNQRNDSNQQQTANTSDKGKSELSPPSQRLVTYCKNQRKNLETLKKNFRNVWVEKDGKKINLDQKQRQEKVNSLKKAISEDCKGV